MDGVEVETETENEDERMSGKDRGRFINNINKDKLGSLNISQHEHDIAPWHNKKKKHLSNTPASPALWHSVRIKPVFTFGFEMS